MMNSRWQRNICLASLLLSGCFGVSPPTGRELEIAKQLIAQGNEALGKGKLEAAESYYRVAAETARIPQAYDGLACVSFLLGENEVADAKWRALLRWYPEYVTGYANYATFLDVTGRDKEAQTMYEYVIQHEPTDAKTRNNYGIYLREAGKTRLARSFLNDSLALTPNEMVKQNLELEIESDEKL